MKEILRGIKYWIKRSLKFKNRIGLKNRNFSIIANNCGGGYIYQYFGIVYNTPTVGLLFDASDFLKICGNPKKFLAKNPEIIDIKNCKHSKTLSKSDRWGTYPVGKIYDTEIYFMHYSTDKEALTKWKRRSKRINYENMILMLLENESCTYEIIKEFCELPFPNKICLTYNDYDIPGTIYSQEVHDLEGHPWKPEIVQSIIDWKAMLNEIK